MDLNYVQPSAVVVAEGRRLRNEHTWGDEVFAKGWSVRVNNQFERASRGRRTNCMFIDDEVGTVGDAKL